MTGDPLASGKDTEAVGRRVYVRKLSPELSRLAYDTLVVINAAESINDLLVPPGNRPEKLVGARAGQNGIRVNDQWHTCFTWSAGSASNVELVDYH